MYHEFNVADFFLFFQSIVYNLTVKHALLDVAFSDAM